LYSLDFPDWLISFFPTSQLAGNDCINEFSAKAEDTVKKPQRVDLCQENRIERPVIARIIYRNARGKPLTLGV
jgi:hypothetical protein